MKSRVHDTYFSRDLKVWLEDKAQPNSAAGLLNAFGEYAAPSAIIGLMAIPATPLPTGGFTYILNGLSLLFAAQMVLGIRQISLPGPLKSRELPQSLVNISIKPLVALISRIENHSRLRMMGVVSQEWSYRLTGLFIIFGCLGAVFAPPFSGLDTLPALGIILMCLGFILKDGMFWLAGIATSGLGIILEVTVGVALFAGIKKLLNHVPAWALVLGFASVVTLLMLYVRLRSRAAIMAGDSPSTPTASANKKASTTVRRRPLK